MARIGWPVWVERGRLWGVLGGGGNRGSRGASGGVRGLLALVGGGFRVRRSSGWSTSGEDSYLRNYYRSYGTVSVGSHGVGFRLCRTVP